MSRSEKYIGSKNFIFDPKFRVTVSHWQAVVNQKFCHFFTVQVCINQVHVKISMNFSRLNFRADWNFVIDQHELYKNFWTSVSRNFYCRAEIRTLLFQTIKLEKLTQRMHRSSKALKIRLKGFTQKGLKFQIFYGRFYCLRGTYCGISCANKISDSQHTGKYFSPYLFFFGLFERP